jgi:hypothetical protein
MGVFMPSDGRVKTVVGRILARSQPGGSACKNTPAARQSGP